MEAEGVMIPFSYPFTSNEMGKTVPAQPLTVSLEYISTLITESKVLRQQEL